MIFDSFLSAGTSTVVELVQQDAIVAQLRSQEPRLTRALRQSIAALGTLLGATPDQVVVRGGGLNRVAAPAVPVSDHRPLVVDLTL